MGCAMYSEIRGDLWEYAIQNWICITTNLGWNKAGEAVMGAGIAKQAADRYPELRSWYGAKNRWRDIGQEVTDLYHPKKLIMLPTKGINYAYPWLSWKTDSSLPLIEQSLMSMVRVTEAYGDPGIDSVYLPPPGCGNGGLRIEQVAQMRIHQSKLRAARTAEERRLIRQQAMEALK